MTTAWPPRYPAPIDPAAVPDEVKDNPLVRALIEMSPEEAAGCEALARADEADDRETVAQILADAR